MKKITLTILGIIIWAIIVIVLKYLLFKYKLELLYSGSFIGIVATLLVMYFYDKMKNKTLKNPFKRLAFIGYKRYYFKTTDFLCLEMCPIDSTVNIGSIYCQRCKKCIDKNAERGKCIWIKCKYISKKRSFKPLKWLKKLLFIFIIALLFSSCSVYVNCNFNKVPKYKTTQQDSTVLQINEYWF